MSKVRVEWDEQKNRENQQKHGVPFSLAQYSFADSKRLIAEDEDVSHGQTKQWYNCFGKVGDRILTLRFTYRKNRIRIIGAGYWRKGRDIYEQA